MITSTFTNGLTKPKGGMPISITECLDTTLRVSLSVKKYLVCPLRIVTGKTVYTRYIGEQHVREDCNNHVPTAKEWIEGILSEKKPIWMMKTMKLNIED